MTTSELDNIYTHEFKYFVLSVYYTKLTILELVALKIRRVQPTRCNVSQFIYFCKTLYKFQTVFSSIIRSSNPARLAAGSSNGLTNTRRCMCSFGLLMMDGKTRLKHVQLLTEINCETLHLVGCTLRTVLVSQFLKTILILLTSTFVK